MAATEVLEDALTLVFVQRLVTVTTSVRGPNSEGSAGTAALPFTTTVEIKVVMLLAVLLAACEVVLFAVLLAEVEFEAALLGTVP